MCKIKRKSKFKFGDLVYKKILWFKVPMQNIVTMAKC